METTYGKILVKRLLNEPTNQILRDIAREWSTTPTTTCKSPGDLSYQPPEVIRGLGLDDDDAAKKDK